MSTLPDGGIPVHDPSLVGEVELPPALAALLGGDAGVSTETDPHLASMASAAALQSTNTRPEMEDPAQGVVSLPAGWIDENGQRHSSALVRELNGRDEEQLSRIDPLANMPQFLGKMLELAVENIGGRKPTDDMLRSLLVGDREALVLGIRIATYGNKVPMQITCPSCGEGETLAIELDKDVPVRTLADPMERQFDVALRKGRIARVALPTVGVQDDVFNAKLKSISEVKSLTLHRCIVSIDGAPVTYEDVLNMGMADRDTIMEYLDQAQPGPDYRGVRLPCQKCEEEFPLPLDLTDLFR